MVRRLVFVESLPTLSPWDSGEAIGVSEIYSSTSARDNGIGAVQRAAAAATTDDQTTRLI